MDGIEGTEILSDPEAMNVDAGARPQEVFTLHFIEILAKGLEVETDPNEPRIIEVRIGGQPAGKLTLYEREWAAIWRAMVHSTAQFERQQIVLQRTGKFR